jgi:hypothetical protein
MTWDWQQIVALICVAGAVVLLARRVLRWWSAPAESGCGSGCQSCAVKDASAPSVKPLVTLNLRPSDVRDASPKP